MRGYGEYCPIAMGAEVFAERWTPIIVRNLMVGCDRFGEILEGAPGLPRSVLVQRLRRLEQVGVVERRGRGPDSRYRLTPCGVELGAVVNALGIWGARWREAAPAQLDPYLMLWTLARLIDPSTLPAPRVLVRFELSESTGPTRLWVLGDRTGVEVCVSTPAAPEDGVVTTNAHWLHAWHTGRVPLGKACAAGGMSVTGPPWLERMVAHWGTLSPFAGIQPAAQR